MGVALMHKSREREKYRYMSCGGEWVRLVVEVGGGAKDK